jgi:AcrR family transcriptional regulator
MPRPRTASDEQILEAAYRVMSRVGPSDFTLSAVARETGLSPASIVQRFGSKRGLLLALAQGSAESVEACFFMVREAHASPLEALIAAATMMTRHTTSPQEMANSLGFLQIDLSDPDFYRFILESSRRSLDGYRALLDDAVAAGELFPCDTMRIARVVSALSGGSLISWAILREGTAEAWVRGDLETLLAPYRRPSESSA